MYWGYVYYAQSHQRHAIAIDKALRERMIATIEAVRALLESGERPPAIYKPRCRGCSLYERCLPQAASRVARYQEV